MEPSTIAGVVGAVALALLGWIGKSAATVLRDRAKRREIAVAGEVEISKQREARPWTLMEARIDDIEEDRTRLEGIVVRQSELIDRIRTERDQSRLAATDWEIAARRFEDQLSRERADHAAIVERLTSEGNRRQRR